MLEKQVKKTYLSLGSNLGDKKQNIEKAKFLLQEDKNFKILQSSSFYQTKSWPNEKNPPFLNIAIECITTFSPLDLFKFVKKIERKLGRKKAQKNSPRVCDIDILDFDHKIIKIKNQNNLIYIPHNRLHERDFVLLPLFEIAKNWIHPKKNKKISDLLININPDNLRTIKLV
ncbi:MAG: 2-amino-4-hydroxy-6-hydroxymethyldihydropteridine diphosphokinase [Pelagibacterales bacterium]|nr:2-amino-4-hydroxy-6-hydroxymethyldihydropteridine diphosphokinase [Pelagibacterales bacterium]